MNKGKFDSFKASLASLEKSRASQGKGSQALQTSNFDGTNGGLLRSAMKFDYELTTSNQNVPVSTTSLAKKIQDKPNANLFSCMDNPKYERDFEITPKVIRKND